MSDKMSTMILEDFEVRAMAYGANIDLWPEEDREAARTLLAQSSEARALLEEARALDATLDLWEEPVPSDALLSRVLADAGTVASEVQAAAPPAPRAEAVREGWAARLFGGIGFVRPGLALAACLVVGVMTGTTLERDVLPVASVPVEAAGEISVIDFAFAMEDDADLLLGSEALL